jgi:hypothetical protein
MKNTKLAKPGAGKTFHKYAKSASSFWSASDFDTSFKVGSNLDFTKLAACQRAIANFVNIVTGKQIPVVFQTNNSSYTDGTTVTIGTKLDDVNFDSAVGLALHEGSHIAYTDFTLFRRWNSHGSTTISNTKFAHICTDQLGVEQTDTALNIIKNLLNWIEDRRIDYKVYTIAPGYRMYYESMYNKYFNDKIIDKALLVGEKCEETWDDYLFHIINFTNSNRQLQTLKQLQLVWNTIDLKNIHRLTNTTDVLMLAIDVYKIINPEVIVKKLEDISDMFNKNGLGDLEPGDGNSGDGVEFNDGESSDDDDDESESTESKGNFPNSPISKLSDNDLKKLLDAVSKQQDFIDGVQKKTGKLTNAQSSLVNALRESGTETRIVDTESGGKHDSKVTTVVIKKLNTGVITAMPSLFINGAADYIKDPASVTNHRSRKIEENQEAIMRGIILGKQLGNKLQLRNSDRTLKTTRLVSGKVDRRLISQLGYDNVNIFHRIVTDKFKNYFIHISIDASGSMSCGNKLTNALLSAVAIAQAASMTTGIRVQISLRGTDDLQGKEMRCITVYAYDSAVDKMSKIKNIFKYLETYGCTPEGIAFKSIEKDIKADAKGDELIFINYSDGGPTNVHGCGYYYNGVTFTKRVVDNMKASGFNVISYYISDGKPYQSEVDNFRTMYGVDSQFIRPDNMLDIAKTINNKFLEVAK